MFQSLLNRINLENRLTVSVVGGFSIAFAIFLTIYVIILPSDKNFDTAIDFIFKNLNQISFICGSHNELSTLKILDLMSCHNIDVNDDRVWFGQLFGMSDNISFNLAKSSYNVFKILPFGPVKNLIPYLIRRAQENSSVKGQSGRELNLIQKEIKRRKLKKL